MIKMPHGRTKLSGCTRLGRDQRGAALVELAVVAPILAVLVVGVIDFGRVFNSAMVVTAAARAGALYGAYSVPHAFDTANITTAVNTVLSSNNMTSGPAPTIAVLCDCATSAGVFTATTPANTCTATCGVGSHMVTRVSVSVTRTFTMGASYAVFPTSMTLTRTSIQRVQ